MWIRVVSLRSPITRVVGLIALLGLLVIVLRAAPRHAGAAAGSPIPIYRVQTSHKAMSLTINVVWGTEYVPQLLRDLTKAHARATFMVGGAWAAAHPALVKAMVHDGMEVGNHGWNHRHPNTLDFHQNVEDIARTNQAVRTIIGRVPEVYAPPYGEYNATVLRAAQSLSMPLVMWTIDTIDWRPTSSVPYMVNKVSTQAAPGAIVLMHPTDRTVQALPQIVQSLKNKGFDLVTVSQLLRLGTPRTDS